MKFKDHADYMAQRNALLNDAETLLQDGNTEQYDAKVEEINALDSAYEDFAQKQADLAAMRGAVKAPISDGEVNRVVASIMEQDNDLEYRKSFMNYVLHGTPISMSNGDAITVTGDVGAVIPNTIINKIVEKLENVGGIYAKLTKTFYKGGVSVPTSAAKPVATWTSERGGSDKQKKALGSITFAYHKLRCVVAVSIAVDNVTLEIFENTVARNIADAMVKAIEDAAFNGTGATNNEPVGILQSTVPSGQTIDITEGQSVTYANLLAAEGALPAEYDAGAEWYMKKATFYNQFMGMVDDNGQPIARINAGVDGRPEAALLGRKVNFVDYVPAFAASVSGDTPFACIYNFADYILNTNLQVTIKEYEDHDTDDQIKKAIMLVDGKPVDLNSLVVMQVKNS